MQNVAQDIVYKCIASKSVNPDKPIWELLKDFKKRCKTTTQNHLDTSGTQKKQHYLSIFEKLKRNIMRCQL